MSTALKITTDGSHTLFSEQFRETYHSTFGAIQESQHIFIDAGLDYTSQAKDEIHILEIGFGTGLNALLSMLWAENNKKPVFYHSLEAFPIPKETIQQLNYPEILHCERKAFEKLHQKGQHKISAFFVSTFSQANFQEFYPRKHFYDLIYFDAFSPETQPEMWITEGFERLFQSLKRGGVLTTYSCKGAVKRALKAAGFSIEKLPGPPGKREFIRATAQP